MRMSATSRAEQTFCAEPNLMSGARADNSCARETQAVNEGVETLWSQRWLCLRFPAFHLRGTFC